MSISNAFYSELRPFVRNDDKSFEEWIDIWAKVVEAQDAAPFMEMICANRYILSKFPGVEFNEDGSPIRNLAYYKAVNSIKTSLTIK